ncbi:hypothetical protein RvY_10560-1 [Ramazzottius varieornatus]|uniref:Aminoacyl-transfer RNA synthetases class-II family profile domain-containing protein n=1 Tax=Ramazzottius varieornatus TaxID=947166 RepID=A0A1D1VKY6_RAMVA|nr:hypothetical protein RvY_10560-1 [Ramazzottius varieornatus]
MRTFLRLPWRRCLSTSGASVRSLLELPSLSPAQSEKTHIAQGWIKGIRRLKKATFFHLDDGSSVHALQVVVLDEHLRNLPGLCFGSAVSVRGNLVASPSPQQPVELVATDIHIDSANDTEAHPFKVKQTVHPDQYRQHLHLRPRVERFASMMRVRSAAAIAIHEFFRENEFFLVHTPVLTTNDAEGGGEAFSVTVANKEKEKNKAEEEFFGSPASLTVSGQLHLESAAYGLKRAYNFNPAFRAERQQSRRHLSEFWMVEAEMAFLDNFDGLLFWMENMLKSVTEKVLQTAAADFKYHMDHVAPKNHTALIEKMAESSFVRVPYDEAMRILEKHSMQFNTPPKVGSLDSLNFSAAQIKSKYC